VIESHHFLGALVLVMVANMAPWVSGRLLRGRLSWPLDFGLRLRDGTRLFGAHKTWRGLVAGVLACAATAYLLGHSVLLGIEFASLSLAADAASSFVKRRLGHGPGAEVPALDQLPEALIPLLVLAAPLRISVLEAVAIAVIFLCLDILAMPLRHWQPRSDR
jgi:CDP-2,3-bis-(O-geranylgeranyl)-sn-glycerol synthase